MHSFTAQNGTVFNFNSDLSGNVIVSMDNQYRVEVPGDDLLEFVAEVVKDRRISDLDDSLPHEIFGIKAFR